MSKVNALETGEGPLLVHRTLDTVVWQTDRAIYVAGLHGEETPKATLSSRTTELLLAGP